MEKNLTTGRPFGVLLRFALPVIGGNLFQLFYTLADTVIVGKTLGANSLAAVGSSSIISYFVLCFVQGFTGGFGICLGQNCGAQDESGMRRSAAASWALSLFFAVVLTPVLCLLTRPMLIYMKTPADIFRDAYDYLFIILLGTGATIFYNIISYMLRALGDSKTPLIFLVFSSLLNIALDVVFILPFSMGVSGAAWATVLSQLLSAILCTLVGLKKFPILRSRRADLTDWKVSAVRLLKIGFPMGFQMSVMCIGQIAMQVGVNALGAAAIAGYTAATKVDQISVLVNTAFGIAISNYVAQNYGAHQFQRIRSGIRASLLQTECVNLFMCAVLLLGRGLVVPMFIDDSTPEIVRFANGYLLTVAPFYLLLGMLLVFRSSIQSMGNSSAPFIACMIELVMRIGGTFGLSIILGYTGICLATPLAWAGAVSFLLLQYRKELRKQKHF